MCTSRQEHRTASCHPRKASRSATRPGSPAWKELPGTAPAATANFTGSNGTPRRRFLQDAYRAACLAFNADDSLRHCSDCGAQHPRIDMEPFAAWQPLAEQRRAELLTS